MMRGASRGSFAAAEDRLDGLLASLTAAPERVALAEDLFAVVRLLDTLQHRAIDVDPAVARA